MAFSAAAVFRRKWTVTALAATPAGEQLLALRALTTGHRANWSPSAPTPSVGGAMRIRSPSAPWRHSNCGRPGLGFARAK